LIRNEMRVVSVTVSRRRLRPGIKWKMFLYLTVFTGFILGLLWLFQVVLLDDIYQLIKLRQIQNASVILSKSVDLPYADMQDVSDRMALERDICISVYKTEKVENMNGEKVSIARPYVDAHNVPGCYIHSISDEKLTEIYVKTGTGENGEYMETVSIPWSAMPDTVVCSRLAQNADGVDFLIILNSPLSPVNATVDTLSTVFIWLTVMLLFGALVAAVIISKKVTEPIVGMSESAKILAKGNYDVNFRGGELRELAELGETLNYAAKELSKIDTLRQELIANISHDLRTPLTMIAGYSEVMRDIPGEMTPENMQIVIDETNRLSSLVNDILDVSRMESGTQKLNYSEFSLTAAVEETIARYRKLKEKDGYVIHFESDCDVTVKADKIRILQVLYNLINNAINYTGDDKKIFVSQTFIGGGADGKKSVRIEIEDTGGGISDDVLPFIWDRYFKVDKVHKRAAVGSGLGLSIVKKILTAHGARFGVISTVGNGSIFWFELDVLSETERESDV
jgi:Signal transduction histidine kinase